MKKIFTNKICQFFPYIVLMAVLSLTLFHPIWYSGDELWNYNFARNILQGKQTYEDFNMLQTPLSAYLSAAFLKITGDELWCFRILGVFLGTLVFGCFYYLGKKITGNMLFPYIASVYLALFSTLFWIYNYNHLNLFLILLLMLLEVLKEEYPKKNNPVLIGIIYGLIPLIKQNTGAIMLMINAGLSFYEWKKEGNRSHFWKRMIASVVPGILYIFFLIGTNTFWAFWDYTVAGIRTFTHETSYLEMLKISPLMFVMGIFPVFTIGLSLYKIFRNQSVVSQWLHLKLLLISMGAASVAYPLCDVSHFMVALIPFVICFFCCIQKNEYSEKQRTVCIFIVTVVAAILVGDTAAQAKTGKTSTLKHFRGILTEEYREDSIREVHKYILDKEGNGQKVIIADHSAVLYMIPIDHYTKDFDLLCVGNVGTQTVKDLLGKYDAIYMVLRDESGFNQQTHVELIHYIKKHYKKIDEVGVFDVYSKN